MARVQQFAIMTIFVAAATMLSLDMLSDLVVDYVNNINFEVK